MKNWRYIEEHNVSASYGLGVDEFLMDQNVKSRTNPISLRLYTYKNYSALSGRFQDISAEIDIEKCRSEGFGYSRRLTGGGAIIMGEKQLGICLAAPSSAFEWKHIRELYELFSKPIIQTLQELGIDASFRSKNDLEVGSKKIAGLGVYLSPEGNIQFHTSLLLDMDIPAMMSVLKIPIQKYSDKKKINSVSQRLTTISKELNREVSIQEVVSLIRKNFSLQFGIALFEESLSRSEKSQVEKIEKDRYLNDDWIFQNSPQADMTGMSLKKTSAGLLRTYIGLKGNTIKSVLITGDFFEQSELLNQIETALKWSPLDKGKIEQVVREVFERNVVENCGMKQEDIVTNIWRAGQRAMIGEKYTYNGSCYYPKEETKEANQEVV